MTKYAPAIRANASAPALAGGNTGVATHTAWMKMQDEVQEIESQMGGFWEAALSQLAQVNPGESQYRDGMAILNTIRDQMLADERLQEAVHEIEGPIRAGRAAAGGPHETCDGTYHSG